MDLIKFLRQIETSEFSPKEVVVLISTILILGLVISNTWSSIFFIFFWLSLVSTWIYLHIKKSKHTWQRFDDIDERDIEFKDEFELRIEKLEQRMAELAQHFQTKNNA